MYNLNDSFVRVIVAVSRIKPYVRCYQHSYFIFCVLFYVWFDVPRSQMDRMKIDDVYE